MATALDGLGRQIATIEPAAASAAVKDVRHDITPKLAKLVVGDQLRGEIISKLTDGSFNVKVAGFTAKMLLPKEYSQGDSVPLRLISVQPRPTFLLDTQEQGKPPAPPNTAQSLTESKALPSATTLRGNPSPLSNNEVSIRPQPETDVVIHLSDDSQPGTNTKNASATLTPRAEQASNLSRTYANEAGSTHAGQAIQKTAQIATPDEITKLPDGTPISAPTVLSQAARVISQVISAYSGDHQTSTITAGKPILDQAPQLHQTAELGKHLQKQIEQSGLFYESHLAQWADGKLSLQTLTQEPQQKLHVPVDQLSANLSPSPAADLNTINQLMNSQLQLLEQQKLIWHGELFPGQKMEWQIERDQNKPTTEAGEQAVWFSSVRFELPHLGTIEAKLNLAGNQLGLSMTAQDPTAIDLIKSQIPLLSDNLQSSGTDLTSFNAKVHEQT